MGKLGERFQKLSLELGLEVKGLVEIVAVACSSLVVSRMQLLLSLNYPLAWLVLIFLDNVVSRFYFYHLHCGTSEGCKNYTFMLIGITLGCMLFFCY